MKLCLRKTLKAVQHGHRMASEHARTLAEGAPGPRTGRIRRVLRMLWPEAPGPGMAASAMPAGPPAQDGQGTRPRERSINRPTAPKTGISLRVRHPSYPPLLQRHAPRLQETGFQTLAACMHWNRTRPVPMKAFEASANGGAGI